VRDTIDFHYHAGDQDLDIGYIREGRAGRARVLRHGPELGLTLEPPRPAEIATCANKCVFCFIHQLPRGMRKSLYVKDDDFRLSFLHGNYITLTDLGEDELSRIETQRLSPLYVSVHATDPDVRHRLLGEPRVRRDVLPVMDRLARAGIVMHAQIVLVPGWNDGAVLERSVRELAALHPGVVTTAVVPVGLTRHRERLPALRAVTDAEAHALVTTIEGWQPEFLRTLGTRFVWPADELYLQAGAPVPRARAYEGFKVAEDGIGLVRRFTDGVARAMRRLPAMLREPRAVTVVTGEMFAPSLAKIVDRLGVEGLRCRVAPVANEWFGRGIGVAGLLTAQDIERQLADTDVGQELLVPAAAVRDGDGVFLDDRTPAELGRALGVPVRVVAVEGRALIRAILGRGARPC
jgi:putative radical SAM enzyme (TIGR03279 family)